MAVAVVVHIAAFERGGAQVHGILRLLRGILSIGPGGGAPIQQGRKPLLGEMAIV